MTTPSDQTARTPQTVQPGTDRLGEHWHGCTAWLVLLPPLGVRRCDPAFPLLVCSCPLSAVCKLTHSRGHNRHIPPRHISPSTCQPACPDDGPLDLSGPGPAGLAPSHHETRVQTARLDITNVHSTLVVIITFRPLRSLGSCLKSRPSMRPLQNPYHIYVSSACNLDARHPDIPIVTGD